MPVAVSGDNGFERNPFACLSAFCVRFVPAAMSAPSPVNTLYNPRGTASGTGANSYMRGGHAGDRSASADFTTSSSLNVESQKMINHNMLLVCNLRCMAQFVMRCVAFSKTRPVPQPPRLMNSSSRFPSHTVNLRRPFLRKTVRLALIAMAIGAVVTEHRQLRAELLIGLTVQNSLISFDSASPGTVGSPLSIINLIPGDVLFGIDRRPQTIGGGLPGPNNGRLYGFGVNTGTGTGRIYTLDESTGAATLISTLAADPADTVAPFPFTTVQGTDFGVDFNPVPDRLRVVSNTGQNLRINVDNGLTQLDVPLAYQTGDLNFGRIPDVTAVAYSNNFGGATSTTLRGVDVSNPDTLVVHTNPNAGTLATSFVTGVDSSEFAGYDISGLTGTPYFAFTPVQGPSTLYTVSGNGFTPIGPIGGGVALRGLAAPVGAPASVPESGSTLLCLFFALAGLSIVGLVKRTVS